MADSLLFFKDVNNPPPGGLWFFETHGERVFGRTYLEIEPKVTALMVKYGIPGDPESVLAAYMCPRIPNAGAYCKGTGIPKPHTGPQDAMRNSEPYCRRQVVSFDEIERRLRICAGCPKHSRDWCPSCTGHLTRIRNLLARKGRPDLPEDSLAGVCQCAGAYESAIASVEYGKDDEIWSGAPDSCWRKIDV